MGSESQTIMSPDLTSEELSFVSNCGTFASDIPQIRTSTIDSVFVDPHKTKSKRVAKREDGNFRISYTDSNSLSQDLRQITDFPDLCDVMFLVGPEEVPIYGVRTLIGARSRGVQGGFLNPVGWHRYFFQLILAAQKSVESETKYQRKKQSMFKKIKCLMLRKNYQFKQSISLYKTDLLTVKVRDIDPDTFRDIISYLHSGRLEISTVNATNVLRSAREFKLHRLRDACLNVITKCNIQYDL